MQFGFPKCSLPGGTPSAGSGRAEPQSPRWVLGVLTPSSAVPAHGGSRAPHTVLFEGSNCSTGLKITFFFFFFFYQKGVF